VPETALAEAHAGRPDVFRPAAVSPSMGRKYRVAHVITRLELGGAQQNTLFCVREHDRRRFEVALIAGEGGLLDAEARAIPDAEIALVPWLRHPISPRHDLQALLRLRDYFKRRAIDVVHTHSSKAGMLGRLAAHLAGVPAVVHTAHGWSFNETQPPAVRRCYTSLERWTAPLAGRLVMVSERNRDEGWALDIGRRSQYAILRSGIDTAEFERPQRDPAELRRELGIEPHQLLVGTVACLKPQKAPLDFVETARAAHAQCDRLRFVIAGDGALRDEVETRIRMLGLEGIVQPLGWRRDVPDLLHAMDLFLLTSRHEGLPRSVLQAMAAGVPVVATAVDGTPEVVRHRESGLLVPPARPAAAAAALLELAHDERLRRSCAETARRGLSREFDIHHMVRDLERIYISLLEEA
jgi:glycosyltransferase involved in cell wall biosynthesis